MLVEVECVQCSKLVRKRSDQLKKYPQTYCSRTCLYDSRSVNHSPNTSCGFCGAELYRKVATSNPGGRFYCNRECMNSSDLKRGPERTASKSCDSCGKSIHKSVKGSNCRNCSNFILFCSWWNGDLTNCSAKTGEAKPFIKESIKEIRGDWCEECGENRKHPIDGLSIVQMDHMDGDPSNHRKENLKLLCPTCHALTINYGARNKGSGRKNRKR